jgi:hypothetical protein
VAHLEHLAKKLAAKWLEKEEKIVAMTVPGGQETKWRKALEWALRGSEIELQLFVGEETKENKGGTRGALVIKATTVHALEKQERLKVGWTQYRTRALERPVKCFRCQEFGHVVADCKSAEPRQVACYRCGGPGHFATNCPEEAPKCYSCGESGHLARSMRCRNYKAAVDQIRRQGRERKPNRRTSQSAGQD